MNPSQLSRISKLACLMACTVTCLAAGLIPALPEPKELRSDTIIFIRTNITLARTPRFTEEVTTEYWEEQQTRVFDPDPFMPEPNASGLISRITYSTNWILLGKFTKERPVQPEPNLAPMKGWQGQQPPVPRP